MVSHPETGLDPPIRPDRESGRDTSSPVLIVPDRGQGYTVYCDASRAGLGCVLMQSERVVAYGSR